MIDRSFGETDLREMLENAGGYRPDHDPNRWIIETGRDGKRWEVIVEPIRLEKLLLIVTAYMVG